MGRKPRIEFNGALYHIIQRGNNKEYIFRKNDCKQYFLSKLNVYKTDMNFGLYGYVVMDNEELRWQSPHNLSYFCWNLNDYSDLFCDWLTELELFSIFGDMKRICLGSWNFVIPASCFVYKTQGLWHVLMIKLQFN